MPLQRCTDCPVLRHFDRFRLPFLWRQSLLPRSHRVRPRPAGCPQAWKERISLLACFQVRILQNWKLNRPVQASATPLQSSWETMGAQWVYCATLQTLTSRKSWVQTWPRREPVSKFTVDMIMRIEEEPKKLVYLKATNNLSILQHSVAYNTTHSIQKHIEDKHVAMTQASSYKATNNADIRPDSATFRHGSHLWLWMPSPLSQHCHRGDLGLWVGLRLWGNGVGTYPATTGKKDLVLRLTHKKQQVPHHVTFTKAIWKATVRKRTTASTKILHLPHKTAV